MSEYQTNPMSSPELHPAAARESATPPTTTARVVRLLVFLLLLAIGAYLLGYEIAGEWSRQWSYENIFGDPYGPRGPLPAAANTTQNVVAGITGVVAILAGTCGALYQLTALRRACRCGH